VDTGVLGFTAAGGERGPQADERADAKDART
jgi:hypothetical protein